MERNGAGIIFDTVTFIGLFSGIKIKMWSGKFWISTYVQTCPNNNCNLEPFHPNTNLNPISNPHNYNHYLFNSIFSTQCFNKIRLKAPSLSSASFLLCFGLFILLSLISDN